MDLDAARDVSPESLDAAAVIEVATLLTTEAAGDSVRAARDAEIDRLAEAEKADTAAATDVFLSRSQLPERLNETAARISLILMVRVAASVIIAAFTADRTVAKPMVLARVAAEAFAEREARRVAVPAEAEPVADPDRADERTRADPKDTMAAATARIKTTENVAVAVKADWTAAQDRLTLLAMFPPKATAVAAADRVIATARVAVNAMLAAA